MTDYQCFLDLAESAAKRYMSMTMEDWAACVDKFLLDDDRVILPEGFKGKFQNYNLYGNKFSDVLSLVVSTGTGGGVTPFTTSPELTTNGMLAIDYYKQLEGSYYQELASMLVFNALIYDANRHFGNFGLLRDNHSGEFIRTASLFNHGLSLFSYAMDDDFKDIGECARTRVSATSEERFTTERIRR